MTEYDNTNRGSIWTNDKTKKTENHPDFTGTLNIDGKEYWVSAWKRKPDANAKAPALSFSVKAKDSAPQKTTTTQQAGNTDFDDDIPF